MYNLGVGFFVGAGIPKGPRVNTFVECGCCGAYHRADFNGDCREDSERHWDLPDDAEVRYLDDERDNDDGLEMHDDSCGECGHPYKRGDETHYPECSRIDVS